ncbi:MAG TPA: class I SAM-dependent methyltransferase [Xanthobacteraceae bacterium]|nr:class I SAM-dependent methyltransferase [Xanthobacteraceae bacterium]
MAEKQIRFDDGDAYEKMMGVWSRLAGEVFLDWLATPPGLGWIDVGCGNGAFTELLVERAAPAKVEGIDPSEGQLAFARARHKAGVAEFRAGDAAALPFPAESFDAAVMALVLFFVPEPAKGVAEMVRVVRPGGIIAAYLWNFPGGGFPLEPIMAEMRAMGLTPLLPPSADASRMEMLRGLWKDARLDAVATKEIIVERSFPSFDDFWETSLLSASVGAAIKAMPPADAEQLKARVRARLSADGTSRIVLSARANAIKGRVPK